MYGHRPIRYHRPAGWKRPLGLGDDVSDLFGDDFSSDPTSVSELVVTATPGSITTTPDAPILSPPIVLGLPSSEYNATNDPSFNSNEVSPVIGSGVATNPVTSFLQSLFPKAPKGAASAPSSSSSNIQLKPGQAATAAATGAPMVNPELAAGLVLAGLVFAAAMLSGHHDRRGSRRR